MNYFLKFAKLKLIIKEKFNTQLLNTSIEELNLSTRTFSTLTCVGLRTVKDIIDFRFMRNRFFDNNTVNEIKNAIIKANVMLQKKEISLVDNNNNDNTSIEELDLTARAFNALTNTGLKTIKDINNFGLHNLMKVRNVGRKTIKDIKDAIATINKIPRPINEVPFANVNDIPIEELNLTARASNALRNNGLKTIKDIYDFGLYNLLEIRNVGKKTIEDIKKAIIIIDKQKLVENEISFVDAIDNILNSITPKYITVVESRYGYNDGKCKTLEEIGNKKGVTKERVRQIMVKEIKKVKVFKRKIFQVIIENLERLLLKYQGIISINDLAKDEYFSSGKSKKVRFMVNLFVDIYEEQYKIFNKYFLTNLSNEGIKSFQSKIRELVIKSQYPIDRRIFMKNILSSIGNISKKYLIFHLLHNENIEILNGKVVSPGKYFIPQRVKFLMRDIDKPMHFTEIAKLYNNNFVNAIEQASNIEHSLYARISDSRDFIIVDAGTFILKEKFVIPNNINRIIEVSKEILKKLKCVSDTRYLINELKKQNIG